MNPIIPMDGAAYRCLKSNKQWSSSKGKVYVFNAERDTLTTYNSRWQNMLLNGKLMLLEGNFEKVNDCPICGVAQWSGGILIHNANDCEDARREKAIAEGK